MRICVDIQSAVAQRAGVGRYTRQLVEHLGTSKSPGDDLSLFYFDFHRRGLDFVCPGATPHPVRWIPGAIVQQAWKRIQAPPFNWFAGKDDLYHFPNFTIPPLTHGKSVVTIHDMSFVRHPEFAETKNLHYLKTVIHDTACRADAIITVSRFSKKEIEETLGVAPERVFAIPLGISPGFTRPPAARIAALRRELKLDRPYLLTVGTLEPRKNIPFMIDVFEKLDQFDGDLVLAGMPGWQVDPILARIRNSPRRDRIRHLDFIPDGQLSALYAGAELFLITSFYEGFGFPPLEAMACGTPVVSSGGGSLSEMLGTSAVTLPGFEAESWAETIHSLLADRPRRDRLGAQGPAHAATYSWKSTAQKTWDVYRKVMS
jgi:glycosyltransferase involved in cell wall biosynthesis